MLVALRRSSSAVVKGRKPHSRIDKLLSYSRV